MCLVACALPKQVRSQTGGWFETMGLELKAPLSKKKIHIDFCLCVWVYTSQNHYLLDLNVYHIFFNNIYFIFLYCTKPRLLKNPQIIPCAFCNVNEGKNKHNNTQHYAPYHNRSLANKSITDLIQYHLTTFQTVKVSAMSEMFQYCFE